MTDPTPTKDIHVQSEAQMNITSVDDVAYVLNAMLLFIAAKKTAGHFREGALSLHALQMSLEKSISFCRVLRRYDSQAKGSAPSLTPPTLKEGS